MNKAGSILKILSFNLLITSILMLIIEVIFGGWFNKNELNKLRIMRDCRIMFNVTDLYENDTPKIVYIKDQYGLRGNYKNIGSIDILTVGGSTADQRYLAYDKTWQSVLEQEFKEHNRNVVIANAGVDGQSTYGHIKNFKYWFPNIPNLKPKYILYYIGVNDFYVNEGFSYDQLETREISFMLSIQERSAIWNLYRTIRGILTTIEYGISHRKIKFNEIKWTTIPISADYSFMDAKVAQYSKRLRILADLTKKMGATPIFVTTPVRTYRTDNKILQGRSVIKEYDGNKYNGVDSYFMMEKMNEALKMIATEKDAVFVDSLTKESSWNDEDFYDFYHMTPNGAQKVGEDLYNALKDKIKLSK